MNFEVIERVVVILFAVLFSFPRYVFVSAYLNVYFTI